MDDLLTVACPKRGCSLTEHRFCWRSWAGMKVQEAKKKGLLPNISLLNPRPRTLLVCADCGRQATEWEHRDYRQPLLVDPVCHSCNMRRGPAKWDVDRG